MTTPFHCTKQWRKKRRYILQRDGYRCQICKRYGINTDAKIVHHIQEVEERPDLKFCNDNLISLCPSCHNKQHPEKGGHRLRY